ncbi:MAG: adenosylmethionine--8-amino-7-oxononanoate transaminase [Nitrospiraceae bacterium]|nr:MAG: adenosylmethionine--8-amino-7-oxononanoate transaminase [Nitrospiraceae bacterium]
MTDIQSYIKHIEELDKQYLWHPFTQMKDWDDEKPVIITGARGSFLKDVTGKWYIDGVSSLWVSVHGHRKTEIDNAIKDQIDKISHSTLLGLAHPPAAVLAEKLIKMIRKSLADGRSKLSRVFYSDNGSTAVEIGLKMAFQYWRLKGVKSKKTFMSLQNAYHGDTLGAVSVGGIDIFHQVFSPLLFPVYQAPSPYCYRCEFGKKYPACRFFCLQAMEKIVQKHHKKIAALIIEPLVQGAGGMIVAPQGYLKGVRKLCSKYDILMIADEVATGFGRTGKMFAGEHEGVQPDILCLAKGITGGYLPLAATITSEEIYSAFLGEYTELKTFFHGHTYTGNQLGCAAAIANLELLEKENTIRRMQRKIGIFAKELDRIREFSHAGDVRQKGFMVGIELVKDKKTKAPYKLEDRIGWKVCYRAREKGVLIRPLGNVVVMMPPLSVSAAELKSLVRTAAEAIQDVTEQPFS